MDMIKVKLVKINYIALLAEKARKDEGQSYWFMDNR